MLDKDLIAQLSGEIQERISLQMETGKMARMEKFAEGGHIDTQHLLAFALAEAKLYTTLYTTDFLMTLAEYEEMAEKAENGEVDLNELLHKEEKLPLQMEANWTMAKVGDAPPENLQIEEVDPFRRSHESKNN